MKTKYYLIFNRTNNRNNVPGPKTTSSCYNDKTKAAFDSCYTTLSNRLRAIDLWPKKNIT